MINFLNFILSTLAIKFNLNLLTGVNKSWIVQ
jgi:hypothetical protein